MAQRIVRPDTAFSMSPGGRKKRPPGTNGSGVEPGAPVRWIYAQASHSEKDECLSWPFSRTGGYAQINGPMKACQLMCTLAHGPRPSKKHGSLHSCGNGALGCINPNHLYWGTQKQNIADTTMHGRSNQGERNGMATLTAAQVREIHQRRGELHRVIAADYGVTRQTVDDILAGKRWKSVL